MRAEIFSRNPNWKIASKGYTHNSQVILIKYNVFNFLLFDVTDTMHDLKLFYCYCPDDFIQNCFSIVIHSLINVSVSLEVLLSLDSNRAIKKVLWRLRRSERWFWWIEIVVLFSSLVEVARSSWIILPLVAGQGIWMKNEQHIEVMMFTVALAFQGTWRRIFDNLWC